MTKEDNPQKGYYNEAEDPEQLLQQPPDVGSTTAPVSPTHNPSILPTNNGTSHQPFSSYEDVLNYMNEHMESKDEEKKRKKREKTQQIITGIADIGRALANLYFTSQYAPNAYDDTKSLSAAHQKRVKEAAEEREKKRKEYYNYAIAMNKLDEGERDFNFKQSVTAERLRQGSERLQLQIEQAAAKASNNERRLALQEGRLALDQQRAELEAKYKNRLISIQQYKAETQRLNQIEHKLQEYTTTTTKERDANGRETGRTTQRVVNGQGEGGKGTGYGSGGDNQGKGRGY